MCGGWGGLRCHASLTPLRCVGMLACVCARAPTHAGIAYARTLWRVCIVGHACASMFVQALAHLTQGGCTGAVNFARTRAHTRTRRSNFMNSGLKLAHLA